MKATALLMIDVQNGFDDSYWGPRNNPDAEKNMEKILNFFRENNGVVIHVQHMSREANSPLRPGQSGNDFKSGLGPIQKELIIQKDVNSAFIGTRLDEELKQRGIKKLVIVGISTNHCVSTTTRMAGNMGYETFVASDATHAFDFKGIDGKNIPAEVMHYVGLTELHREFATVLTTDALLSSIK